jgi:hypothetical protein
MKKIIIIAYLLAAFLVAGTMDYQDQVDRAAWEIEQGR